MSFKSSTPKREECITPIQILTKKDLQADMIHCHNYEDMSIETQKMIQTIVKEAKSLTTKPTEP